MVFKERECLYETGHSADAKEGVSEVSTAGYVAHTYAHALYCNSVR